MGRFIRWLIVLFLPLAALSQQSTTAPQQNAAPATQNPPTQNPPSQNTPPPQLHPRPSGPSLPPPSPTDRQITLDVQVADRSGIAVRGLQKQDFTLLDDKQAKNIVSFHAVDSAAGPTTDPPVEVVLVVDAVNASFQAVNYERNEIKKFLLANGGKLPLPVSLVVFTDAGAKIQDGSSRDGNALAALYDQYETGVRTINRSQGFYGAAERYDLSLKTLSSLVEQEEGRPGRKLMIWCSPGWPLLSGPNVELTRKDEQAFFNSIVAISTGLRRARITLYNVSPQGPANAGRIESTFYENFLQGVTAAEHAQPGDLGLQVLAVQSGGRVFNTTNHVTSALASCASDANSFYVLSFDGARADQPDEYHSLAIKIDKPKVTARTRT